MKPVFEFTGFAGLALALHVAAFQSLPQGSESAGSGGDALVTLVLVSGSLSGLVEAWDNPPVAGDVMPAALRPLVTEAEAVPQLQRPDRIQQSSVMPPRMDAPALPRQEELPTQEMTRSAPLPPAQERAALSQVRPQARPDTPVRMTPAAKPAAQQASRPASTAAGGGAASARGTSGPAETASLTKAMRQSLMAEWGAKIRSRIDQAKSRGSGRGSVTLVLTVARDGTLQSVGIAASSGQASLDQRAVQAVRSAGRLPAAPAALGEARYTFRLPIRFD